jgi:hypothetical protein
MKTLSGLLSCTLFLILLNSCASVRFYSGSDLKKETGLRFYTAKPYLLVELQSAKDNTVKTSVVWLPDLSSPQYIAFKPGFGSNEIKMAFTNSSLNSYGSISESQIPETINAIAGLINKGAVAAASFTGPPGNEAQQVTSEIFRLYEIVFGEEGTTLREVSTSDR